MKKFKWTLQRLLDVTLQREKVLQTEMAALAQQIEQLGEEIKLRRAELARGLSELEGLDIDKRIVKQELFMRLATVEEERIVQLNARMAQARNQRETKKSQFIKTRASRQTLERLREEAKRRHMMESLQEEQKHLDEIASVSHVRRTSMKV